MQQRPTKRWEEENRKGEEPIRCWGVDRHHLPAQVSQGNSMSPKGGEGVTRSKVSLKLPGWGVRFRLRGQGLGDRADGQGWSPAAGERQCWRSTKIFLGMSWFLQESHMEERAKFLPGTDAELLCSREIKGTAAESGMKPWSWKWILLITRRLMPLGCQSWPEPHTALALFCPGWTHTDTVNVKLLPDLLLDWCKWKFGPETIEMANDCKFLMPWASWSPREHSPMCWCGPPQPQPHGSLYELAKPFASLRAVCVLQIKQLMLWWKGLLQTMLCFLVREFAVLHSWLIFRFSLLYKHKGINEVENTAPQLLLVKFLPLFHERSSSKTKDLVEIFLKKFWSPGLSIGAEQSKQKDRKIKGRNKSKRQTNDKSRQLLFYRLLNKTSQIPLWDDFAHGWF